ncbi:MAG: chromosomal replication initiator protein DnaA [Synergistaceae bacterium]|nr:chromosomal replication initiator protein DnaA [Synergistaceae bacterium]
MQQNDRNPQEIWKAIIAGAGLSEGTIQLWLESCDPIAVEGEELVVDTPNSFVLKHITENSLPALNQSAAKLDIVKSIRLKVSDQGGAMEGDRKQDREARAREAAKGSSAARINLNPNYTFETFVVGKSNRLAHAASVAVAEMPGKAYNPLFIWGGVGLGKTHLMHAICHYALQHSSNLKVLYLSAEKFVNEFVTDIRTNRMPQFKERYRKIDILLMDDIQFFGNKEGSQEEFFHTFNDLRDDNKQIVICSDRQPSELKDIEERLTSRFAWGLVTDIQPPDLETRIAILQKKAMSRKYAIPDDVIHFLAQYIPSNIRELEGALNRVIMSSELAREEITIERVSEWLKDILRMDLKSPVTIEGIKSVVAESFGVSLEDLASAKRTAELALARQVAMFLCREMTNESLQKIAQSFRKKDHTTVIHAQRKIGDLIRSDADMKRTVDNLRNKL